LDNRPVIVAIAGPNGSGKTTFFHSHLPEARFALYQRRRHRPRIEEPAMKRQSWPTRFDANW
jgi:uridine kinase